MEELTIGEMQRRMEAGTLTAVSLCQEYLSRVDRLDRTGPTLRAVIEVNPDALEIAGRLDQERQARGPRGPLHGIPIMLKDNFDTADRMMTTAGSLALVGPPPPEDATVARKLREAGAVILGKTNLSEWANFRSTRSTSGWSSRGGQTRNPYALDRNPCGSSSGSGAAAAANLCAAAVGTETDGSVVCPAQANSIVGIKPTVGLVSRAGIVPVAHSQDTAGPMARCVADAAILLGAMTGVDPRDPVTTESRGRAYQDYTPFLKEDGLQGARIGVARSFSGFHPGVDQIMEWCIGVIKGLGAEIVDPVEVVTRDKLRDPEFEVLLYEFKADLNGYLEGRGPAVPVSSLEEIIAFNDEHRDEVMPHFGQEIMSMAQEKGPLTEGGYQEALDQCRRLARDEGIDATLREHKLDAIMAPSGGPAWLTDWVTGDHFGGGSSSPAAVAGYPNITVPAGYLFGLPVGVSFFAGPYQEPALISIAYAFEQATQVRRPPAFPPSADLGPRGGL